jgi:hypothetical protein
MAQKRNADNKKKCKQHMAQKWLVLMVWIPILLFGHPKFFKRFFVLHSVYALDYIHDLFII